MTSILEFSRLFLWGGLILLVMSCHKGCPDLSPPADFSNSELSKFPVFNKLINNDTLKLVYTNQYGNDTLVNIIKEEYMSGYVENYSTKNSSQTCQNVSYKKLHFAFYCGNKFNYNGYVGFELIKYNSTGNYKGTYSDTIQLAFGKRYIGDTLVNNKLYKNVWGFQGAAYSFGNYYFANLTDGLICFTVPYEKKIYHIK